MLINTKRPWEKSNEEAKKTLDEAIRNILNIGYALKPFLPGTAEKIEKIFRGGEKLEATLFPRATL